MHRQLLIPTLVLVNALAWASGAELKTWPVEMRDDADLHDVCWAGDHHVWAVGDRGATWHSTDAGTTWQLQPPLSKFSLSSISFAGDEASRDPQVGSRIGIMVGGGAGAYGLPSQGVVLRTTDGGATWEPLKKRLVPALSHVAMQDTRNGIAIGDAWTMFPSALFRTSDGGRTWNSGPGRVSAAWVDGDFAIPDRPLLVSRDGDAVAVSRTTMGVPKLETHHINAARWLPNGGAIAVGDEGALLISPDGRLHWQDHRHGLPPGMADQFDFKALHVVGPHVWIAGSPGTMVFRSADAGRTWSAVPTGQSLPVHSIDFAAAADVHGELNGVAVGAFGMRLSTHDAGSHWQSTPPVARRAGALVIAGRATSVPLDLIADLSAAHGLRCRVVVLESEPTTLRALEEAVRTVGGDGVTVIRGFEIPPLELSLSADAIDERWRQQQALPAGDINDHSRGAVRLAELITKQIRIWRPELVFAACGNEAGLDEILDLTVEHAAGQCGELDAYPEQIAEAGLAAWRVQRALHVAPARIDGDGTRENSGSGFRVDPAKPLPAISSSISARVALARTYLSAIVDDESELAEPSICRSLDDRGAANLIADLPITHGSESRRASSLVAGDRNWLVRQGATHHNIQMLLARLVQRHSAAGSAEQLAPLVRDLAPEEQSRLLYSIAQQFHSGGSTDVALETIEGILRRQKKDTVHHAAVLQKIRWTASTEVHHMLAQQTRRRSNPMQLAGDVDAQPVLRQVSVAPLNSEEFKKLMRNLPPAARSIPWVQLTEAATRRLGASAADRSRIYERLRKTLPGGPWRRCATTETWLAEPRPDPRKPVPATIRQVGFTNDPPVLDGIIAEPFWENAALMTFQPLQGTRSPLPATQARIARDDRYLYLALECHTAPFRSIAAEPRQNRQRDTDLSSRDRVEVSIDVNRDYSSGWHLSIDHRGWANDACQRDASWNPSWHIARQADDEAWSIEAAIPLEEITPVGGQYPVWLIGLRRVIPTLGVATWPPSERARMDWSACGYLLVEQVIHQLP